MDPNKRSLSLVSGAYEEDDVSDDELDLDVKPNDSYYGRIAIPGETPERAEGDDDDGEMMDQEEYFDDQDGRGYYGEQGEAGYGDNQEEGQYMDDQVDDGYEYDQGDTGYGDSHVGTEYIDEQYIEDIVDTLLLDPEQENESFTEDPEYKTLTAAPHKETIAEDPEYKSKSESPEYKSKSASPEYRSKSPSPEYNSKSPSPESAAPERESNTATPEKELETAAAEYESIPAAPIQLPKVVAAPEVDEDGVANISGSEDEHSNSDSDEEERSPDRRRKRPATPLRDNSPYRPKPEKKATRLVSYGADFDESDEETHDTTRESDAMEAAGREAGDFKVYKSRSRLAHNVGDVKMPPEPPGRCSNQLQEKINKLLRKVMNGYDLRNDIQKEKEFRNPAIYEKLIEFCEIDEKGTNYPPELYDPSIWGPDSFYDELAKQQKVEMDKREKERKERTKVEFVTGTKKIDPSKPRASKWDSHPSNAQSSQSIPPVTVITTATGTKGTVIPAVGAIPKKK